VTPVKRCVVALVVGLVLALGVIAVALAPRSNSAGQPPSRPMRADAAGVVADVGSAAAAAVDRAVASGSTGRGATDDVAPRSTDSASSSSSVSGDGTSQSAHRPRRTWADAPPADPAWCTTAARAVVVDRAWQRAWLCDAGKISVVIPVTTARSQPDPGMYTVYDKDWDTFSDYSIRRSILDRFVAFAVGEDEGARVGFHAIPRYEDDGTPVQPAGSLGTLGRFGDSSGCIRLLPEHADLVWNFLQVDDAVLVIS
jgi:hypothetical protein